MLVCILVSPLNELQRAFFVYTLRIIQKISSKMNDYPVKVIKQPI